MRFFFIFHSFSIAIITYSLFACSNSEFIGNSETFTDFQNSSPFLITSTSETTSSSSIFHTYLPLDDTEYPYAGIPRIVIETENHQAIKDRETEIPAKLQIWGAKAPETEIKNLTIRGRGNTSWDMPKKSYKIEFSQKQSLLNMPPDRDWALIANYADKTLMKNYLMYNLSASLDAYYAPRCEFIELYLNKEYLGVYLLTETIKVSKNRVNIPKSNDAYLIEADANYRKSEQVVFSTIIKNDSAGRAFRVHEPKNASDTTLSIIEKHIQSFETYLKKIDSSKNNRLDQWIDINEYLKHYWVQEFSKNPDASFRTSVFFTWQKNDVIKIGPVWDFDLAFGNHFDDSWNSPEYWYVKLWYWNPLIFKDPSLKEKNLDYWIANRETFYRTLNKIDSVHHLLQNAAQNNFRKWNILQNVNRSYHKRAYATYDEAIDNLKEWIRKRTNWINEQMTKGAGS